MDFKRAEAWLNELVNQERLPDYRRARFGLDAVRALLARCGAPHLQLPAVAHIAGSKGKGSTALLLEAVARAQGAGTGVFTSPHLISWRERFRINGRPVAEAQLAEALTALRPHADALRAGPHPPSFFDVVCAAAFWLFARAQVAAAVFEVGLGGRLDSTNICAPAITLITSIELEHTEVLGKTHAAIAAEKAGIIKPGVPVLLGGLPPAAREVAIARAQKVGAPVLELGAQFEAQLLAAEAEGSRFRFTDGAFAAEFYLRAAGAHQVANAALALAAARRLDWRRASTFAADAARALQQVQLPGRCEIISRAPWLLVDAAHTHASVRALLQALQKIPPRRRLLVISVSKSKDAAALCAALAPHFEGITATCADAARSMPAEELAAALRAVAPPECAVAAEANAAAALAKARAAQPADALLCAAGSVYLAGIARRVWGASPY